MSYSTYTPTVSSYLTPEVVPVATPPVVIEPTPVIRPYADGLSVPPTARPTVGAELHRVRGQLSDGISKMSLGSKAGLVMDGVGTLLNAYNAYKANKLAKQQFAHAKEVHAKNWDAQRKQTNSQLEDRQRRRVAEAEASGRTTTSVADYMAKYGV